jgi:hypothetical protein
VAYVLPQEGWGKGKNKALFTSEAKFLIFLGVPLAQIGESAGLRTSTGSDIETVTKAGS